MKKKSMSYGSKGKAKGSKMSYGGKKKSAKKRLIIG